jgi:hypothetical protein
VIGLINGLAVVTTVCMDGAAACIKALFLILTQLFLCVQRCAAHGASLTIKDASKLRRFEWALRLLVRLICFIKSHETLAIEIRSAGGATFEVPANTRFGKLYLCAEKIMKMFPVIKRSFSSDTVVEWLRTHGDKVYIYV